MVDLKELQTYLEGIYQPGDTSPDMLQVADICIKFGLLIVAACTGDTLPNAVVVTYLAAVYRASKAEMHDAVQADGLAIVKAALEDK
jgi:hypothetical protein